MYIDSSTSLFSEDIIFIFRIHLLLGENTINIVEIWAIVFKKLAKSLSFDLMGELVECISVDKELFSWGMGMKVKIEHNLLLSWLQMLQILFETLYGGAELKIYLLLCFRTIYINSV